MSNEERILDMISELCSSLKTLTMRVKKLEYHLHEAVSHKNILRLTEKIDELEKKLEGKVYENI